MNIVALVVIAALFCYVMILRDELNTDSLTKTKNRRVLTNRTYVQSVLFIDCIKFKQINDTYGHGMGDKILKHVANVLVDSVRKCDTVVRYGGDEFVVLLKGDAEPVVQRIKNKLKVPYTGLEVGVSIGISYNNGETLDELIKMADANMYTNK